MRYRVVEQLVELASPADEQIPVYRPHDMYVELWKGYMNDAYFGLSYLKERAALSPDIVRTTDAVAAALFALRDDNTPEAFSEEGIRHDPRWERIRELAQKALDAFNNDLGIPIPSMSDPDYNVPRDDAP